jgi:hypothetical protein
MLLLIQKVVKTDKDQYPTVKFTLYNGNPYSIKIQNTQIYTQGYKEDKEYCRIENKLL